jgi:hypothetical protein
MNRLDGRTFNERRKKCSKATQELLAFLETVAEHAGPDGSPPPTFEVRGVGVTYWNAGKRFCRFDPKPNADQVWVLLPGADRDALEPAGKVSPRTDGPWVTIKNMHGAVRLAPEILRAYDASAQKRHVASRQPSRI